MGDQARANAGGMPRPANAAKRSRTQGIHYNRRIDAHLRFARTRAPFALGGANARPHRRPVRAGVLQQARLRFLVCLSPFTPICRIDRPPGCLLNPEARRRRSEPHAAQAARGATLAPDYAVMTRPLRRGSPMISAPAAIIGSRYTRSVVRLPRQRYAGPVYSPRA